MIIDSARQRRHREVAWLGFDRIVDADTSPGLEWWQHEYRSPCGTGCCYAGHLAIATGSQWLVHIQGGRMFIDGTPVTATDHESVPFSLWEYILATADDPQRHVSQVRGKPVIHVAHRAAHLIGLNLDGEHDSDDDDALFAPGNTREDLERLITEQVGPRP